MTLFFDSFHSIITFTKLICSDKMSASTSHRTSTNRLHVSMYVCKRRNVYRHLTDYFILCRFSSHSVVLFEAYNPHAFLNFKLAHVIAPYMEQPHTHTQQFNDKIVSIFFFVRIRNWNRNKIAGPVFFLKQKSFHTLTTMSSILWQKLNCRLHTSEYVPYKGLELSYLY